METGRQKEKRKDKAKLHKKRKFDNGCMNFMYFGPGRWMGPWTVARTIVVRVVERQARILFRHPAV